MQEDANKAIKKMQQSYNGDHYINTWHVPQLLQARLYLHTDRPQWQTQLQSDCWPTVQ